MEKCILVDGSGLIYRGFYAIPPFFKSPDGVQTNAVFGFTNILISLLATQKPDYMAVAFDRKGPTFRHKEYEAYKATRVKAPQELYDQIPLVKDVVASLKIPSFELEGYEADDILATLVKKLSDNKNIKVLLATGDFDLFQLASYPDTSILYPTKGFKESQILSSADIEKKYGIPPQQIPDYKGIAGDTSDNIPGVRGIGPKGAVSLLQKFGSLENIYNHLGEIPETTRKKLEAGKESAFLGKKLTTLVDCTDSKFDLDACKLKGLDIGNAKKLFEKLGFKGLSKRLESLFEADDSVQNSLF